jgi:hypothetical protein
MNWLGLARSLPADEAKKPPDIRIAATGMPGRPSHRGGNLHRPGGGRGNLRPRRGAKLPIRPE